jgi:hypothetical protein
VPERVRAIFAIYLAYVDESGDDGVRGSRSYALGCVMIDCDDWSKTFDRMIACRRHVRATYGIPVRAEIKANRLLLTNGGTLRENPLGERARFKLCRAQMPVQPKLGITAFAW